MVSSFSRHLSSKCRSVAAEEAASATGRVEDGLVLLRVEDLHHQLHGGWRGEVLSAVATQIVADQFLIGDALDVRVGGGEVIGRDLADDKRQRTVGERELVAVGPKSLYSCFTSSNSASIRLLIARRPASLNGSDGEHVELWLPPGAQPSRSSCILANSR